MTKQVVRIGLAAVLLTAFLSQSFAQGTSQSIDLQADAYTRASAAIALAVANGHNVQVSVDQLADALGGIERASFVDNEVEDEIALSAGNTKRYKCSKTKWYAGNGLTINWWADAKVSNGRITSIESTGWNYEWVTWLPTFDAVVTGTSSASIQNSGRKIKINFDGTVKYWFAGLPVSTRAINLSCTKNA